MEKQLATFEDFSRLDIRVGTILTAEPFPKARRPAYRLTIDFGPEIGVKKSSAQITDHYRPEDLPGIQVLGVVNFPPRQIADFMSEVLVLGTYSAGGVILITPQQPAANGKAADGSVQHLPLPVRQEKEKGNSENDSGQNEPVGDHISLQIREGAAQKQAGK